MATWVVVVVGHQNEKAVLLDTAGDLIPLHGVAYSLEHQKAVAQYHFAFCFVVAMVEYIKYKVSHEFP